MTTRPHLTILFDNEPGLPGLTSLWGFAALVRLEGRTVLFDTGSNGRVLLRNMAALGLSPESVDLLFLSHPHWDHMGGLDSFLELNPGVTVALHDGFSKHLIHDLRSLCGELIVIGADAPASVPLFSKLFRLTFFEIEFAVSHTNTQSASATKVFSVNCERLRLAIKFKRNLPCRHRYLQERDRPDQAR
jgi:glyoxylase-like metal-dependent hydrolase (beta-lactamase superfamily II)